MPSEEFYHALAANQVRALPTPGCPRAAMRPSHAKPILPVLGRAVTLRQHLLRVNRATSTFRENGGCCVAPPRSDRARPQGKLTTVACECCSISLPHRSRDGCSGVAAELLARAHCLLGCGLLCLLVGVPPLHAKEGPRTGKAYNFRFFV